MYNAISGSSLFPRNHDTWVTPSLDVSIYFDDILSKSKKVHSPIFNSLYGLEGLAAAITVFTSFTVWSLESFAWFSISAIRQKNYGRKQKMFGRCCQNVHWLLRKCIKKWAFGFSVALRSCRSMPDAHDPIWCILYMDSKIIARQLAAIIHTTMRQ